jgi:hypothetical protein
MQGYCCCMVASQLASPQSNMCFLETDLLRSCVEESMPSLHDIVRISYWPYASFTLWGKGDTAWLMRIRGPALAVGGSGGARPRCGGSKAKSRGLFRRHNNGHSQSECFSSLRAKMLSPRELSLVKGGGATSEPPCCPSSLVS